MASPSDVETSQRPHITSEYERFSIRTHLTPPRRKEPRPFNPKVSKIRLARWLAREILQYGFKLRQATYRKVLLSRPCIYDVFGGRLGGFHPIKDRCTGCFRCVEEQPEICRVDRNPEFFRFPDAHWIPKDPATAVSSPVATVSYEAATGSIPIKGMGYREAFCRGRHGLDQVLYRVSVDSPPDIEQVDCNLSVRQEQREDVPLCQIFGDRMVIREVSVVNERFVEPHEGVGAAWMPHSPLRRVPVMSYPDMCREVLEFVVMDDLVTISNDLEDDQVFSVRENEGFLLTERCVEFPVEGIAVLIDEFVLL